MSRQSSESSKPQPNVVRGGRMTGVASKAKNPMKTVKKLVIYLSPHKNTFIIVLICSMSSTIFSVIGPRLLGRVTTSLVEGLLAFWHRTGLVTDFPYMMRIVGWLIVLYIISSLCSLAQGIIMARLSVKVTYKLRTEISEKMHKLPINYYDTRSHGEVLSRVTNDVDMMSQTLNRTLTQLVTSITTLLGVLVMMIWISPLMTLAAILVIPPCMMIMMAVMKRSHSYFSEQQKTLGALSGIVEET